MMGINIKRGLLLAIFFLCLISPVIAFSGSGAGTSGDPYQLTSWQQLQEMNDNLTASYILMNNLDLGDTGYDTYAGPSANSGAGWKPIGNSTGSFSGTFDGDGYNISDVFINRSVGSGVDRLGFFGGISSATINNTNLYNITIYGTNFNETGGLAGIISGSEILNTYLEGHVENTFSSSLPMLFTGLGGLAGIVLEETLFNNTGTDVTVIAHGSTGGNGIHIGGFIGFAFSGTDTITLDRTYALGDVSSTFPTGCNNNYLGGLIGRLNGDVRILNSFTGIGIISSGSSFSPSSNTVGGLVGYAQAGFEDPSIINSYSKKNVTGGSGNTLGGLLGGSEAIINKTYSTGYIGTGSTKGGLIASNYGTVENSVYDTNTSGQTDDSGKGVPKTTEQMKALFTFTNLTWDFDNVWGINNQNPTGNNSGYPFLRWQIYTHDYIPSMAITIIEPQAKTYADNESLELNYTIDEEFIEVDSCWFKIVNSTGYLIIDNQSIADCGNTTFDVPRSDTYNLTLYVNESEGYTGSKSVEFGVVLEVPAVGLDYPTNNLYLSQSENIDFNFTATDDNLETCLLYSNFTGDWGVNGTFDDVVSGVMYNVKKNLSDGNYLWNVWCNNSFGGSAFALNNFTLVIDTVSPTFSNVSHNNTMINTLTTFSILIDDETALNPAGQYIFSINNYGSWVNDSAVNFAGTSEWANVTKTLNSTVGTIVSYRWYITDNAGNSNYTEIYTLTTTPLEIWSIEDLSAVDSNCDLDYILMADLDFNDDASYDNPANKNSYITGNGLDPLCINPGPEYYQGTFDGNDYTISNLYINRSGTSVIGLFGAVGTSGIIKDLGILNISVVGGSSTGGLVGEFAGAINNSYCTGNISGTNYVGGLVGRLYGGGSVEESFSSANANGSSAVGGLVGWNHYGTISKSFSNGSATSTGDAVGGLVGYNKEKIYNCYSEASANGHNGVGGLVGWNNDDGIINSSYSTGDVNGSLWVTGGLVGLTGDSAESLNSFYDNQTSGQSDSDGGTGKTTVQMKDFDTFNDAGWDIVLIENHVNENIWYIDDGNDYPKLEWELDQAPPSITIIDPKAQNYPTNESLALNYNVHDFTEVDSCWFKVINSTGSLVIDNQTITDCENTTFDVPGEGVYNLTLYANDTLGNEGSADSVEFGVVINAPAVVLNYPTNNLYLSQSENIDFNFTATDDNLETCLLYSNFTGDWGVNGTFDDVVSGVRYQVKRNLSDEGYLWNVKCNNTGGNSAFALNNFTITIDTIDPVSTIQSITTTNNSQTISFNSSASDLNLVSCKYTIYNTTGGVDGLNNNVSITCNSNPHSATVTYYGNFTLRVYARDLATNEHYDELDFTTSQVNGTIIIIGGGGGAGEEVEKIPTIALKQIIGDKIYNDLERAIFYARINTFCSIKKTQQTLAIQDFSGECSLRKSDIEKIQGELFIESFQIPVNDLILFYEKYNARELEQVYMTRDLIETYDLFTSVLGIVNPMIVNPPRLDRPFIITGIDGNITIEHVFVVNKKVKECSIISGEGFQCEIITDNSVKMILYINDTDFFDKIFQGEMSITSDAEPENIEVRRISLFPRVYNLSHKIMGIPAIVLLIGLGVLILTFSIFFIMRSRIRKKLKRRKT